jgi:hypothetical protein
MEEEKETGGRMSREDLSIVHQSFDARREAEHQIKSVLNHIETYAPAKASIARDPFVLVHTERGYRNLSLLCSIAGIVINERGFEAKATLDEDGLYDPHKSGGEEMSRSLMTALNIVIASYTHPSRETLERYTEFCPAGRALAYIDQPSHAKKSFYKDSGFCLSDSGRRRYYSFFDTDTTARVRYLIALALLADNAQDLDRWLAIPGNPFSQVHATAERTTLQSPYFIDERARAVS